MVSNWDELEQTIEVMGEGHTSSKAMGLLGVAACLVAEWLKCWTAGLEVPGSGSIRQHRLSLLRVHSAPPQN